MATDAAIRIDNVSTNLKKENPNRSVCVAHRAYYEL